MPGQVWYGHSRWHAAEGGSGPAAAAAVLTKARNLLPDCLMLHFAAAELEESRGETDAARAIFEEQVQVQRLQAWGCQDSHCLNNTLSIKAWGFKFKQQRSQQEHVSKLVPDLTVTQESKPDRSQEYRQSIKLHWANS